MIIAIIIVRNGGGVVIGGIKEIKNLLHQFQINMALASQ